MATMQAEQVAVGDDFPNVPITLVTDGCAAEDNCPLLDSSTDLFSSGRNVLVGMPGAFTPTCTDEHLPGYIRGAGKFRSLGVSTVAVVTTNDRFLLTAWKRAMSACLRAEGKASLDGMVSMLADKDADLIKALGVAYNSKLDTKANKFFQLNAGIRSKRFALVVEEGRVAHVAVDEGETDLDATSAESILAWLEERGRASRPSKTRSALQPTLEAEGPGKAAWGAALVASLVGLVASQEGVVAGGGVSFRELVEGLF